MNDGDTALVVGDELFVDIAKRNMEGIVPLYYEMKGAEPECITRNSIYASMTNAYSGGNIGAISNNITKIWNHDEPNLDMVKLLCLENNFTIDYAKSLFKPQRPGHIKKPMAEYTKKKVPYFFMYAKDKMRRQVEKKNKSTVNMLKDLIPDDDIVFKNTNVGEFDYETLKSHRKYRLEEEDQAVIDKYEELDLRKYFLLNYSDDKNNNLRFIYDDIAEQILEIQPDRARVVDILVEYLFVHKESSYKTTLWESFGSDIVENLKRNIEKPLSGDWVMCDRCGERIPKQSSRTQFCGECSLERRREVDRIRKRAQRQS